MSETAGHDAAVTSHDAADTSANSEDKKLIEKLLFRQDLDEVHLLIDFVSGRPDRSLNTLSMPDPENPARIMTSGEVMRAIADMRYPPEDEDEVNARNAAILLVAKDRLTLMAAPANGLSIAYTRMFIDVEGSRAANFRRRRAARPKPQDIRVDLALRSFPGLQRHAERFYRWRTGLGWFCLVWLLLTGIAYWDAGLGRAALERLDQDWKGFVSDLRDSPKLARCDEFFAGGTFKPPKTASDGKSSDDDDRLLTSCRKHEYQRLMGVSAVVNVWRVFACSEVSRSLRPLHVWCWRWLISGSALPDQGEIELTSDSNQKESSSDKNKTKSAPNSIIPEAEHAMQNAAIWQAATAKLSVFTTYVLPMMFGLLGTLIGAFRAIVTSIGLNELRPRDLVRMKIGFAVGLVAGVAVGLFFSPSSVPMQGSGGVAGQFTLTACGLGFLAGYASQSFFSYLDTLLGAVFPISVSRSGTHENAAATTLPPQPVRPAPAAAPAGD